MPPLYFLRLFFLSLFVLSKSEVFFDFMPILDFSENFEKETLNQNSEKTVP